AASAVPPPVWSPVPPVDPHMMGTPSPIPPMGPLHGNNAPPPPDASSQARPATAKGGPEKGDNKPPPIIDPPQQYATLSVTPLRGQNQLVFKWDAAAGMDVRYQLRYKLGAEAISTARDGIALSDVQG